jgi:uncharacterized membrane protein YebE (DUF533 family)
MENQNNQQQDSAKSGNLLSSIAYATAKLAAVAGLAYGGYRLYKHFTATVAETTEV